MKTEKEMNWTAGFKVRTDVRGGAYWPDMSGVCNSAQPPAPTPPQPLPPYPPQPVPPPLPKPPGVVDYSGYCG